MIDAAWAFFDILIDMVFTPAPWVIIAFVGMVIANRVEEFIIEPWRMRKARPLEDYE